MNWLEAVENPEAVTGLFEHAPSLENVEITTVELNRDGPTLTLSILLREYPTHPPARWQREGSNAAALRLQMIGVESLTFEGWTTENRATITLERAPEDLLLLLAIGATLKLSCSGGWLHVKGVTAYQRQLG